MLQLWYSKLSLRTKVTGIALGITALSLAVVATTSLYQIRSQIAAEERRSADSVAMGIARAAELALTVGDQKELGRLAASFLRDDNVLFIAAYGKGMQPIASAVRDHNAWALYRAGTSDPHRCVVGERQVEASAASDEFTSEGPVEGLAAPGPKTAAHQVIGRVVVGLSTAPAIEAQQRENQFTMIATVSAATVGGIVLFLTLGRWMRRLQRLADASRAISAGDFAGSIEDEHNDEIGRLARSFDDMRLALRRRDFKLREFTETLQEQVKERTKDLEHAVSAAEEANRAKSMFLANMSHELRTPLNGVIGMVNLLLSTEPNAQQRRYCDIAKSSGHSLLDLINDILDFSKIEAGKLDLDFSDFNLHEVLEGVTQMLGERAEKKQIELACSVGKNVPETVSGDPVRLRQVILNLMSNAIKFTDVGEVVIGAVLEKQTETKAVVKFTVKDSGIGIPPDRLDRLFKSFSQVDTSTTRKFGGTGLGLAISQRLVELMGGTIGVRSEVGKGSVFWFTVEFTKRAASPAVPRGAECDPRGLRVLAVDDNQTNREILHTQLASWSLRPEVAGSADEAITMLNSAVTSGDPYRFAILDMHMPKTDGLQLAKAIRLEPTTQKVILISLSSISDQLNAEKMNQLGFSACLTKPVLPSQLYNAIVDSLAADEHRDGARLVIAPTDKKAIALVGVRVLLAEDNEVNQLVACELLERAGCKCTLVVNGREAVDEALRQNFDVILMDCQMPELDGFEATRLIREAESHAGGTQHRAIIALTANAIKGDREQCLAAGMDGYVTKPIEPMELFAAIQSMLPAERAAEVSVASIAAAAGNPNPNVAPAVAEVVCAPTVVAPPVDIVSLERRCMGNRKLAAKALGKFDVGITREVEALSQSIRQHDAKATAATAHKIKGAAANVSADRVRNVAAEIEKLAKADALAQTEVCLGLLDQEMREFREYLATALRQLAPAEDTGQAAKKIEPSHPE